MSEQDTQDQLARDMDPEPRTWNMVKIETELLRGWEPDPDKTGIDVARDVIQLLMALSAEKDARIQNLQLKLGQLVERGP